MAARSIRTTRHKVSKACWRSTSCKRRFIQQYEDLGEFFLYTEEIASNPSKLWAVFQLP